MKNNFTLCVQSDCFFCARNWLMDKEQLIARLFELEEKGLCCLQVNNNILQTTGEQMPSCTFSIEGDRITMFGDLLLKLWVDKGSVSVRPAGWSLPLATGEHIDFGNVGIPVGQIAAMFLSKSIDSAKVYGEFALLPNADRHLVNQHDSDGDGHVVELFGKHYKLVGLRDPGFSHNTLTLVELRHF